MPQYKGVFRKGDTLVCDKGFEDDFVKFHSGEVFKVVDKAFSGGLIPDHITLTPIEEYAIGDFKQLSVQVFKDEFPFFIRVPEDEMEKWNMNRKNIISHNKVTTKVDRKIMWRE